uniref:DUF2726 domain-containing protein n=1 Tax=Rhabditophanes sp. KR3021 TaxID=114890 RepID=A0AC35U434_9BILA
MESQKEENIEDQVTAGMTKQDDIGQDSEDTPKVKKRFKPLTIEEATPEARARIKNQMDTIFFAQGKKWKDGLVDKNRQILTKKVVFSLFSTGFVATKRSVGNLNLLVEYVNEYSHLLEEQIYKFDMLKESTEDERSLFLKNAKSNKISKIGPFRSLMPEIIAKLDKNGKRVTVTEEENNLITYGSKDIYIFKCTPTCECPSGHEFNSSINDRTKCFVSRGRVTGCLSCISCKTCHYNSMKTHAPEAYANLCKSEDCHVRKKENVVPIKEYENIARQSHSKVCMECPKCETHHSQVVYSIVNQGPCCHDCDDKVSVLHGKTKELLLAKYGERVHPEHKFDDCRGKKNRLPFDIFISPSLLVEVDGAQHFNATSFGMSKEKFEQTQSSDKMKNDFCRQNGLLSFVRIAYTEYNKLEEIVEEFTKAYDNLKNGEKFETFYGKVYTNSQYLNNILNQTFKSNHF